MSSHKPKLSGRRRGVPNKTSATVKEAILKALDTVGGHQYLVMLAVKEPKTFATLLGRVLPLQAQITGADGGPVITEIRRTIVKPNNSGS